MFQRGLSLALTFLIIEFLDEFVYGAREAAWPLIRTDLDLSYIQVGVLLGLPRFVSGLLEPFLGILGDVWRRRVLILGGGVVFALALLLTGFSPSYGWLLAGFLVFSPASGAFVSLSQATLMDVAPTEREANMAHWTLAGSVGVLLGPLALGLGRELGAGWRHFFIAAAAFTTMLVVVAGRSLRKVSELSANGAAPLGSAEVWCGLRAAFRALRRGDILRWLTLLEFSDLMLDVLLGYLALYFVDVVGVDAVQASAAVALWTAFSLLGDALLIPLLLRVSGLKYLRVSAVLELALFSTFLLLPFFRIKLLLLALLGLFNAGWYAILTAQIYEALPGRSGTAMAAGNIFGLLGSLLPWAIGWAAERLGLASAMWFLILGPLALWVGLPWTRRAERSRL